MSTPSHVGAGAGRSAPAWMKPAAFVLAAAAVFLLSRFLPLAEWLRDALAWIDSLGSAGPLALGLVYIVGCVLMFPCFILTVGAGALFGVVTGFITVSFSSTLGATAAFLAADAGREWSAVGKTLLRHVTSDAGHYVVRAQALIEIKKASQIHLGGDSGPTS